ncbi:MFS transporter, partial [Streptomyces sp. NPDC047009]
YLLCYVGAALLSFISGQLSNTFSLPQIALGYGSLALVAAVISVLAARNPHTDLTSQHGE